MEKYYNEVWRAFPDSYFNFHHIIVEGTDAACMFSMTGIQKEEFIGIPPSDKQIKVDGMVFLRFKDSKIVERWEILDLLNMVKQLNSRQQLRGLKNALLEFAEVKTNTELRSKISKLFGSHS
jgi:SnoaL-like polyketide cyclase